MLRLLASNHFNLLGARAQRLLPSLLRASIIAATARRSAKSHWGSTRGSPQLAPLRVLALPASPKNLLRRGSRRDLLLAKGSTIEPTERVPQWPAGPGLPFASARRLQRP